MKLLTRGVFNSFFSQGCVYLYDSEGSIAELLDIHNADFVGIDCLTAGTQYCVVREWICHPT